jgi:hypothetical protein
VQKLLLARLPNRLHAHHPRIIEELLEIAHAGQIDALREMIEMLHDFHRFGSSSRYAKKFKGLPIWELKTTVRGGTKGGARVYFFFAETGEAVLVNAEVKSGDSPSQTKIKEVLVVYKALEAGIPVLKKEES